MVKSVIATLLMVCVSLKADESALESRIAQLQQAPKEERYRLMNEIKRALAQMNAQQRAQAIGKLRNAMQTSGKEREGGTGKKQGQMHSQKGSHKLPHERMQRRQMPHESSANRPAHMPQHRREGTPHR